MSAKDLLNAEQLGALVAVEPKPLPSELLPVAPFPVESLPDSFRPWVLDVSERMSCPVDFVAVPMLIGAASLVGRQVGIRPEQLTDWFERGNLWGLIVGRPGIMKSPAMAQALAPLERLEAKAAEAFNGATSQHHAQALAKKLRAEASIKEARAKLKKDSGADVANLLVSDDEDDVPPRSRYVINDPTYEKLGEVLSENPGGVLMVRDEMRGLFMALGREDAGPARAFYVQAWSGGTYTFDRIGRGTVTVPDARLSVVGCIQPGPLSDFVQQARRGAADDGMLERFLIAWPDPPGEWQQVDRLPDAAAKRQVWEAFERLDSLTAEAIGAERELDVYGEQHGLPFLRFVDEAREAFGEWRADLEQTIRAAEAEALEGALSKFRHHIPALALTLHVVDGGQGPVALASTERALALADYFESHARRVHNSGLRCTVQAARALLKRARAGDLGDLFSARDVYRNQWSGLADRQSVADALDLLVSHDWLTEHAVDTGERGGRPTSVYALTEGARRG